MYSASSIGSFQTVLKDFKLDGMMMRYSNFMPRLYNYCLSLGMEPGKIMPSRAFCSDESQGFPIILIASNSAPFLSITAWRVAWWPQIGMVLMPCTARTW
jgi:hypothetical protein